MQNLRTEGDTPENDCFHQMFAGDFINFLCSSSRRIAARKKTIVIVSHSLGATWNIKVK